MSTLWGTCFPHGGSGMTPLPAPVEGNPSSRVWSPPCPHPGAGNLPLLPPLCSPSSAMSPCCVETYSNLLHLIILLQQSNPSLDPNPGITPNLCSFVHTKHLEREAHAYSHCPPLNVSRQASCPRDSSSLSLKLPGHWSRRSPPPASGCFSDVA